ncbi:MAG: translation initiation factor IF-1 [Patescibacteria group bacterium]
MKEQGSLVLEGQITEVYPGLTFQVTLENGHLVVAKPSGKLKQNKISILRGDWVRVEISPYDLTKGRIVYRLDKKNNNK